MHRQNLALIALAVAVFAGCDSTPTSPSTANVAGAWEGSTCAPARTNVCTIRFDLSQSGASLSGTYGTTSDVGTITGTVSGSTVSLVMKSTAFPNTPERPLILAFFSDPDELSGTYTAQSRIALTRI